MSAKNILQAARQHHQALYKLVCYQVDKTYPPDGEPLTAGFIDELAKNESDQNSLALSKLASTVVVTYSPEL